MAGSIKNSIQNKNIRRKISGIMAGVMVLTTIGSYTYLHSKEVAAKDTLDSIVKVVGRITDNDPYTILEVTPGYAPYIVSLNGLDGNVYSVSGNQLMGQMGYYVSGSEPVRADIRAAINDTVSENISIREDSGFKAPEYYYFRSSVSDSNMRYELTDMMFSVLDEQGILNNPVKGKSVLESDRYFTRDNVRHYSVYNEKREGDVVWEDNERYVIGSDNYDLLGFERLDKIYKKHNEKSTSYYEDGSAYIDRAKGRMIREDDDDFGTSAGNYVLKYDYADSLSDSNIGYDFLRDLLAGGVAEQKGFRYVSVNSAQEEPQKGDFEPGLKLSDDNNEANVIAAFKAAEEADSGYRIVGVDDELTFGEYGDDTPVYIKDGDQYIYVKTFGELGLSSNNVTGYNSYYEKGYYVSEEAHLLTAAASTPNDILTDETTDIDAEAGSEKVIPADGDDFNEETDEPVIDIILSEDRESDLIDQEIYNDTASENSVEDVEATTNEFYVLRFEYVEGASDEQLYNVLYFNGSTPEYGAQYVVDENNPLITVLSCDGCIEADKTSNVDFLVYDYVPGKGNYKWQAQEYGPEYDPLDIGNVVRIRGAEIYYRLDFTNNEWFKQYALDRNEGRECENLNVIVNTVSVNGLLYSDITEADMTSVVSASGRFTLYDYISDWDMERFGQPGCDQYKKKVNDFPQDLYKKMIERVVTENIPAVADYNIIVQGGEDEGLEDTFVRRYVSALMLNSPDKYFDAINNLDLDDDTNNREPAETPNTMSLSQNSCHFVNESVYIYNMKWTDQASGEYVCFLNPHMFTMSELNANIVGFNNTEVSDGFEEVLLDIQNENLYRETDNAGGKRELLDTSITEATVLRYIIGYAEKREESYKGKMRILEIEPTPNFNLQVNDSGENVNEYNNIGTGDVRSTTFYKNGTFGTDDGKLYFKNDRNNPIVDQADTRIELTRMSVAEFIGHIEDLNAEYDMIYIGMNIDGLNTTASDDNDVRNGLAKVVSSEWQWNGRNWVEKKTYSPEKLTVYNDAGMRGLVYSNIGDYVYMKGNLLGNSPYDYKDQTPARLVNKSSYSVDNMKFRARYSGNDITAEDVKKLTEFLDAGYPVVLDDEFFTDVTAIDNRTIDTNKVDSVSYMYQFVHSVKDRKNVFALSNMNKKLFNWYLNLSKPELTLTGDSKTATEQLVYINLSPVDNYYHATYNFNISNKGAASSESTYNAALYIDINADGKYSHSQEGIKITEIRTSDGQLVTGSEDVDGNVVYSLRTGVDYVANCQLAASFEGVVPWRLEITQNDNTKRRTNATGYYQINRSELTPIKVLQIMSGGDADGTWNMDKTSKNPNNIFGKLLNDHNIVKYDVDITAISANNFDNLMFLPASQRTNANKTKETYLSELENYDMLVMGFQDCYRAPNNTNAILAIQEYIADGNSVLFSHDCSSYVNYVDGSTNNVDNGGFGTNWGYNFNKYIRNLVGMDRYNVLGSTDWDSPYWSGILSNTEWKDILDDTIEHNYDKAWYPKRGVRNDDGTVEGGVEAGSDYTGGKGAYLQNQGYSWFGMNNKRAYHNRNGNGVDLKYRYVDGFYDDGSDGQESNNIKYNVTKVNDGQITKYPYNLPSTFKVAGTHGQYYQLDFTADDDMDGETDIVVWYCIGDSTNKKHENDMYELTINDVRNNYYIYNKGSVTYTGVGHSAVLSGNNPIGSEDEVKLFINTLIACYQQGAHEPSLKIVENYDNSSRNVDNIYLSYDKSYDDNAAYDTNGVLDNTVDVYFSTEKASLIQNAAFISHEVSAKLYYEAASTDPGAVELTDGAGNKFYGIEITPTEFRHLDNTGNETGDLTDMDALIDKVVYKARIPILNQNSDVMWTAYGTPGTTVSSNSLNARRILVVTTDTTTNSKTGKSKEKSNVKAVSLVRAQMFMLE